MKWEDAEQVDSADTILHPLCTCSILSQNNLDNKIIIMVLFVEKRIKNVILNTKYVMTSPIF